MCVSAGDKAVAGGLALQGSLYAPADAQLGQWWRFLLTRGAKDAALFLRKWLREGVRKAGLQPRMRFKAGRALISLVASVYLGMHV